MAWKQEQVRGDHLWRSLTHLFLLYYHSSKIYEYLLYEPIIVMDKSKNV